MNDEQTTITATTEANEADDATNTMTVEANNNRTRDALRVHDLIGLIQAELDAAFQAGIEHYRKAGEMLIEAKAKLDHGQWTDWLKRNFALSHSQACKYMKLAKNEAGREMATVPGDDGVAAKTEPEQNSPVGEISTAAKPKSIRAALGISSRRKPLQPIRSNGEPTTETPHHVAGGYDLAAVQDRLLDQIRVEMDRARRHGKGLQLAQWLKGRLERMYQMEKAAREKIERAARHRKVARSVKAAGGKRVNGKTA